MLWREEKDLPEEMVFWVNYLGGNMRDITLNFSKPGRQVVCQYYNFIRLGKEGYRKVHNACYATAQHLAAEIKTLGPFEIIYGGDPQTGIPCVCWRIGDGEDPGFNLFDLADRLRVRHGVSRDLADLLLEDIRGAIDHLQRHPASTSLTSQEASGFHH